MLWRRYTFIILCLIISACSSSSVEQRAKSVIGTAITGQKTSFGNKSECTLIRNQCVAGYTEWYQNGEIACVCPK